MLIDLCVALVAAALMAGLVVAADVSYRRARPARVMAEALRRRAAMSEYERILWRVRYRTRRMQRTIVEQMAPALVQFGMAAEEATKVIGAFARGELLERRR